MPDPGSLVAITGLSSLVTAAAAAAGAVVARGSTAVPAAVWAAVAAVAFGVEALARSAGRLEDPSTASAARLLVVAVMVCPAMSLLGAKRPQHGVWQLIVLSLGITLSLPAFSALLVRPGTPPDVHLIERVFILVLLLVGLLNFVATRHGLPATLVAAGQLLVARPLLPGLAAAGAWQVGDGLGAGLAAAGSLLALRQSVLAGPRRGGRPAGPAARIDAAFLAMRETFGAAWALRIAERFDAIATHRGWPCRLTFRGLEDTGPGGERGWEHEADRAFRALARRFVNADWLARHGCDDRDVDRAAGGG